MKLDQLLLDLNQFLVRHASLNPSPSADDKPYRTVKTILYHLANTVGAAVCSLTYCLIHILSLSLPLPLPPPPLPRY